MDCGKKKNKNKNNIKKKQIKVSSILQLYFFDYIRSKLRTKKYTRLDPTTTYLSFHGSKLFVSGFK